MTVDLPVSVCQRDGRVVPFEADRICQSIFRATEVLGQPNAFLAREMTDGVLHFLAQEHGTGSPTTAQIADLVVKVLRELGQPLLAQGMAHESDITGQRQGTGDQDNDVIETLTLPSFTDKTPEQFLDDCRRLYSQHGVLSRDLLAAQNEGFLSLAGLERPGELAGGVIPWTGQEDESLLAAILEARRRFGGFIVLDSPEIALAKSKNAPEAIRNFVRELGQGLEATGLKAIVNLDAQEPPAWANQGGQGPLFPAGDGISGTGLASVRHSLLQSLLENSTAAGRVRIDWHLGESDIQSSDIGLSMALTAASQGQPVSFVFDRAKMAHALAEGVDRRHPAVLQVTGLHLNRLADMDGNLDHFLQKLLHLAQMALSAGVQKRRFLRHNAERNGSQAEDLRRGFFLDRARLCVIPVGLPAVVQRFAGQSITGKEGMVLARQIVERLGECLTKAGRSLNLDAVLDSPWWMGAQTGEGTMFSQPHLVGLTSAAFAGSAEEQLRAAGSLHQLAGGGTGTLLLPADLLGNIDRLVQILQFAWKKSAVVRVRLLGVTGGFV